MISWMLNVPRETVGSIIRKFKMKTEAKNQPGRTKKMKISATATRFMKTRGEKCFS